MVVNAHRHELSVWSGSFIAYPLLPIIKTTFWYLQFLTEVSGCEIALEKSLINRLEWLNCFHILWSIWWTTKLRSNFHEKRTWFTECLPLFEGGWFWPANKIPVPLLCNQIVGDIPLIHRCVFRSGEPQDRALTLIWRRYYKKWPLLWFFHTLDVGTAAYANKQTNSCK